MLGVSADAAHDQPGGDVVFLAAGGERGERDFGDVGVSNPPLLILVEDRVRMADRRPGILVDGGDRESAVPSLAGLGKADEVQQLVAPSVGGPHLGARTRRWSLAVRPGWKLEASRAASPTGAARSNSAYRLPQIDAVPESGWIRPSSIHSKVVLPAPLGPRKPVTAPHYAPRGFPRRLADAFAVTN